jgi:hypothetical protein
MWLVAKAETKSEVEVRSQRHGTCTIHPTCAMRLFGVRCMVLCWYFLICVLVFLHTCTCTSTFTWPSSIVRCPRLTWESPHSQYERPETEANVGCDPTTITTPPRVRTSHCTLKSEEGYTSPHDCVYSLYRLYFLYRVYSSCLLRLLVSSIAI